MERDVDKYYKKFKELDDIYFERMISLLAKYFYREKKKCFSDDYMGYSICDMLNCLSDKSLEEVMYQVDKSIENNEFFARLKKAEEIIKNKSKNLNIKTEEKEKSLQYYEFVVTKYALSDSIEALINNGAKEIIVIKVDDDLIVRYKPYWRG